MRQDGTDPEGRWGPPGVPEREDKFSIVVSVTFHSWLIRRRRMQAACQEENGRWSPEIEAPRGSVARRTRMSEGRYARLRTTLSESVSDLMYWTSSSSSGGSDAPFSQ